MATRHALQDALVARIKFTSRLIAEASPPARGQRFLWDSQQPALGLRVTASGARSFVFESKLGGRTIRMTIGSPATWSLPDARVEAGQRKALVGQGKDPRVERAHTLRAQEEARAAQSLLRSRLEVTGLDAWEKYCEEGRLHGFRRGPWSALHYRDHVAVASPGGERAKRSRGKTRPGPLNSLLSRPLAEINAEVLGAWVRRETALRPTRAALAFRLFRAFLNWCAEHSEYGAIVDPAAAGSRKVRDKLPKPRAKKDALQREQLAAWFSSVQKEPNVVIAAYLQSLLLTGARPEEWMGLRWQDVNFAWKTLSIRDKVDGRRTIGLTPYVAQLLSALSRHNDYVFSSDSGASGRLRDPRHNHRRAVADAGLPHLTLQGLRRSFGTLSEWVDCPEGIVEQIQGHKPNTTAKRHYRVRAIDILRSWHEKIERWMLSQASIVDGRSSLPIGEAA